VRLAQISVAHLYNLRRSARYRNQAAVYEPIRPTAIAHGGTAQTESARSARVLRVDTVHPGDRDGAKGALSPSLWFRHCDVRCAGQAPTPISVGCDSASCYTRSRPCSAEIRSTGDD
jgi:hypothetical protein